MAESKVQLFDACRPLVRAGNTIKVTVDQTLTQGSTSLLDTITPDFIEIQVEGPRTELTPADIEGVYPAPGSEDSPDEFLPHIALKRRTLPWERVGSGPDPNKDAWLALLLVRESELKSASALAKSPAGTLEHLRVKELKTRDPVGYPILRNLLGDETSLHVVLLPKPVLKKVMPKPQEVPLLCHMKRLITDGTKKDCAIVISNRLPDSKTSGKPEIHTALLVSLEGRPDLFDNSRTDAQSAVLVVLHHWTFRPTKGGDFEQVIQSIRYRPNGGVLRFGNLPSNAPAGQQGPLSGGFAAALDDDGFPIEPLPHTAAGNLVYRGPLRPFPTPPRSIAFAIRAAPEEFAEAQPGTVLDQSHAAAFEIGRLLALSNAALLDDLHDISMGIPIKDPELTLNLPSALQKPDWVVDPAWHLQPWTGAQGESLVKTEVQLTGKFGEADVSGIADTVLPLKAAIVGLLSQLPAPGAPSPAVVELISATSDALAKQFPEVFNAGLS